ncbi:MULTISPECIES: peptide MFS transporter [unclassified Nonomuraea]|uniref:peptide MFS transporter n=1 Tax=unclassified Nonomuraea TaxID=2593643 RepID=UPI0035C0C84F
MTTSVEASRPAEPGWLFGQPRWFGTLFMVDMWERFSFYGMRAILILYLVAPAERGGLGVPVGTAAALFGLYMSTVFLAALPGGWISDRLLGPRRTVLVGAVTIAAGHYAMAVPSVPFVYAGLTLIAAGTGLLKPSMGAMVSHLYPHDTGKRDAAWSVFYMSIQVSALLAPLVTGFLGERVDWHLGFAAAGVGMTFGVVQYVLGLRHFADLGARPPRPMSAAELRPVLVRTGVIGGAAVVLFGVDVLAGTFTVEHLLALVGITVVIVPILYYRSILRDRGLLPEERRRVKAFLWLLLASAVFWMPYDQGGSLLNLFAERSTDRVLFDFELPASWFQSLHPGFILLLAPLYAWFWVRKGQHIGTSAKFAVGLLMMGASFVVMAFAALGAAGGAKVSMTFLVVVYLLQVAGELALAPPGMSALSQAAPRAYVSQMMGVWWLFAALGVGLGGQLARISTVIPQPVYFAGLGGLVLVVGLAVSLGARRIDRGLR